MNSLMSIKKRLQLVSVFVMVMVSVVTFVWWQGIQGVGALQQQSAYATGCLQDAHNAMWQLRFGVSQYLTLNKPEERRKVFEDGPKSFASLDNAIQRYESGTLNVEQASALRDFKSIYKQYKEARPHWFDLMEAGKVDEAADCGSNMKSGEGSVKALTALMSIQEKTNASIDEQEKAQVIRTSWIGLLTSAATLIALFISLSVTTGAISKPLLQLSTAATRAVNENDFSQAVPRSSVLEVSHVTDAFNLLMEKLRLIVGKSQGSMDKIAANSDGLRQSSSQVTSATQRQSDAASEVAMAIEQLSKAISDSSSYAREFEEIVDTSQTDSLQAMKMTTGVMDDVARIALSIKASAEGVHQLAQDSSEINGIVDVINEIADQTNLLALNAAIEAARAGESGRGFAVVADEVRKLSERTAKSTEQIRELVERVQEQISQTVDRMKLADEQAGRSITLTTNAQDALKKIADGNVEISRRVKSMAQAMREENTSVQQITRNVETIAQMASENGSSATMHADTAQLLSEDVSQLRSVLKEYRVQ